MFLGLNIGNGFAAPGCAPICFRSLFALLNSLSLRDSFCVEYAMFPQILHAKYFPQE
jgi:hypothetical protein